MPGGDRTGPTGAGPMTGRAAGYCSGNQVPGYANTFGGRGYAFGGRGRGGMGRRNRFNTTGLFGWQRFGAPVNPVGVNPGFPEPTGQQELEYLKNQAQNLASAMDDIQKHIEELETESKQQNTAGK